MRAYTSPCLMSKFRPRRMRLPSTLTCRFRMLNSVTIASPHVPILEPNMDYTALFFDLKLAAVVPVELRLIQDDRRAQGKFHRLDFHATDFAMFPCQAVIRAGIFSKHKGIGLFVYFTHNTMR